MSAQRLRVWATLTVIALLGVAVTVPAFISNYRDIAIANWQLAVETEARFPHLATPQRPKPPSNGLSDIPTLALGISFVALLVTMTGTTSTILLGWRADKRQSREYELRIAQLQAELHKSKRN